MNYWICSGSESKVTETTVLAGSFNTEHKIFIRENWNRPLIKFLSKRVNSKLIYMGLPSPKAEDLNYWLDFIKIVIAFQCRDYGKRSEPDQSRIEVEKLEKILRELEREKKIEDYVVYDGYLEEVVLRGYDNSPQSLNFNQTSIITLYNLDFCNDIASPIEYTDRNGNWKTAYKFNAIQKLLELQNGLSGVSDKFVVLLTVHCSYKGEELHNFINEPPNDLISQYLKKYLPLKGNDKNSRIIRLFICHQIQTYFIANNFSYKILPVIKYNGIGGTPLIHFVILGTKTSPVASGVPTFQSLNEMLNQSFVKISADGFQNEEIMFDEENVRNLNPVDYFTHSRTYEKLWK